MSSRLMLPYCCVLGLRAWLHVSCSRPVAGDDDALEHSRACCGCADWVLTDPASAGPSAVSVVTCLRVTAARALVDRSYRARLCAPCADSPVRCERRSLAVKGQMSVGLLTQGISAKTRRELNAMQSVFIHLRGSSPLRVAMTLR